MVLVGVGMSIWAEGSRWWGKIVWRKEGKAEFHDVEIIVVELLQLLPRFADSDTPSSRFCSESSSSPMAVIVLVSASRSGIRTVSCLQVMVGGADCDS